MPKGKRPTASADKREGDRVLENERVEKKEEKHRPTNEKISHFYCHFGDAKVTEVSHNGHIGTFDMPHPFPKAYFS